jgi:hypothetical protein
MKNKKIILLFCSLFSLAFANAQVDFAHLVSKGSAGFGWGFGGGAFLEWGLPLAHGDKIIVEPSNYFFGNKGHWVFIFPILTGYRHILSSKGYGLYVQGVTGYTIGSTAIVKTYSSGEPVTNARGDTLMQKGHGFTAGLGIGYLFSSRGFWNDYSLELRYENVFNGGYPKIAMLSLRYVYTMSFRRRRD